MPIDQPIGKRAHQQMVRQPLRHIRERCRILFRLRRASRQLKRRQDPHGGEDQAVGRPGECGGRPCHQPAAPHHPLRQHHSCHERHHGPAPHQRMERRGGATREPGAGKPPPHHLPNAPQHQCPRQHLRLAAADHPFAGGWRVPHCEREQSRTEHPSNTSRQHAARQMPPPSRQRQPAKPAADPRRLSQRQSRCHRAEQPVENAVGVGRFQEKIARSPVWVGGMPGLGEVVRLVGVGGGPGARCREEQRDQNDFGHSRPSRCGWGRRAVYAFAAHPPHL